MELVTSAGPFLGVLLPVFATVRLVGWVRGLLW